jgi:hypothetical protein
MGLQIQGAIHNGEVGEPAVWAVAVDSADHPKAFEQGHRSADGALAPTQAARNRILRVPRRQVDSAHRPEQEPQHFHRGTAQLGRGGRVGNAL